MPPTRLACLMTAAAISLPSTPVPACGQAPDIYQATLNEPGQRTSEISTEELQRLLMAGGSVLLDARPFLEFAISHIPGALNVAPKPGVPMSAYVSDVREIDRLVHGDHATPLLLYCNGPHCGKSKRLADELLQAGFANVRRYQLGIPVWRALGGVTVIEPQGLRYVLAGDHTAVVIDAREAKDYAEETIPGARNLPRSGVLEGKDVGEVKRAKDDGRLPMEDHNTRLVVVAATVAEARYVAEALTREAFDNVTYFPGTFADAQSALRAAAPAN
jgi:rhodanese-related sulfurtransferase